MLPTLPGLCTLGALSLSPFCTLSKVSLEIRASQAPSTLTGSGSSSPLVVLPQTAVPV